MVVVRSSTMVKSMPAGMEAFKRGHGLANAVHRVNDVGAGLAENDQEDGGLAVHEAGGADVLDRVRDIGDVRQA